MRIVYHDFHFTSTNYCAHWGNFLSFVRFGLSTFGCLLCPLETVSRLGCLTSQRPGNCQGSARCDGLGMYSPPFEKSILPTRETVIGPDFVKSAQFYPDSDGFRPFTATQNKRGYAHLTERGADIPGTAKNDSAAVKLAQEGKLKRCL